MLPGFVHLRALAAVMEEGGVRAASKRLGISHSAISRSLSEIEAATGVAMIQRQTQGRKLELTPEGRVLGKATIAAISGLEAALSDISSPQSRNGVVIATTASFAARWLFPRMNAAKGMLDGLDGLDVSVKVSREVAPPQSQGADLVVRMGNGPWSESRATALCNDWLLPVASPGYLRSIGPVRMITEMRLLHDRDPCAQWRQWVGLHGPADADCEQGPRYNSGDILLRAAECGEGVALARLSQTRDSLTAGLLVAPFGDKSISLPDSIWLIENPATARRRPVERVAQWLRKTLADEEGWPDTRIASCG